MKLIAIVAHDVNRLIGNHGPCLGIFQKICRILRLVPQDTLLWWEVLPFFLIGRPLPNRRVLLLFHTGIPSRNWDFWEYSTLPRSSCKRRKRSIYYWRLQNIPTIDQNLLDELWVSEVPGVHEGDTHFPEYQSRFRNDLKPKNFILLTFSSISV